MKEHSAGGIVVKDKKVLLVKVKNLSGRIVWTFPKGHLEKDETSKIAALREVLEETGYNCKITKPLGQTRYFFERNGNTVNKKVDWFLMEPIEKVGNHDSEVITAKWVNISEAKKYLEYLTDFKQLEKIL